MLCYGRAGLHCWSSSAGPPFSLFPPFARVVASIFITISTYSLHLNIPQPILNPSSIIQLFEYLKKPPYSLRKPRN